jgi:hypothetical protein
MTMIRIVCIAAMIMSVPSGALAQSGTPEQRAACRPDVRRFCYMVRESDGTNAYLECLQAHRARLTAPCRAMLESNRQ